MITLSVIFITFCHLQITFVYVFIDFLREVREATKFLRLEVKANSFLLCFLRSWNARRFSAVLCHFPEVILTGRRIKCEWRKKRSTSKSKVN
jgi:hypothetical protein